MTSPLETFQQMILRGPVRVTFDTRFPKLEYPAAHRTADTLTVEFGRLNGQLETTLWGVKESHLIGGQRFRVKVPWLSVWRMEQGTSLSEWAVVIPVVQSVERVATVTRIGGGRG